MMTGGNDRDRIRRALRTVGSAAAEDDVTALLAVRGPELRVQVHGWSGPQRRGGVRMHIGILGPDAGALTRDPVTGAVRMQLWRRVDVSRRIVAALPDTPAGSGRLTADDLLALQAEAGDSCPRDRAAWGRINVYDSRGDRPPRLGLLWIDILGDGRYYLERGRDTGAFAIDAETFADVIDSLIRRSQRR
jgi:hypothetical protein